MLESCLASLLRYTHLRAHTHTHSPALSPPHSCPTNTHTQTHNTPTGLRVASWLSSRAVRVCLRPIWCCEQWASWDLRPHSHRHWALTLTHAPTSRWVCLTRGWLLHCVFSTPLPVLTKWSSCSRSCPLPQALPPTPPANLPLPLPNRPSGVSLPPPSPACLLRVTAAAVRAWWCGPSARDVMQQQPWTGTCAFGLTLRDCLCGVCRCVGVF